MGDLFPALAALLITALLLVANAPVRGSTVERRALVASDICPGDPNLDDGGADPDIAKTPHVIRRKGHPKTLTGWPQPDFGCHFNVSTQHLLTQPPPKGGETSFTHSLSPPGLNEEPERTDAKPTATVALTDDVAADGPSAAQCPDASTLTCVLLPSISLEACSARPPGLAQKSVYVRTSTGRPELPIRCSAPVNLEPTSHTPLVTGRHPPLVPLHIPHLEPPSRTLNVQR